MSSSPFDLLSIEVIQEIFLSCLTPTFLPPEESDNYIVQLVISQVSSTWRSIALGTLRLWDNFILSVYGDWQQAKLALQLASLWLHRAGSLPITLTVLTVFPQHNPHIQDLYRLISSHRFKSLAGNLQLYWLPLHDRSYEGSFASLESLRLDVPKGFSVDSSQPGQSPDGDNCCQLPSLRYLNINFRCINMPWQGVLHMIPWHQLTKLVLNNFTTQVSTIIKIMCECKALVECDLFLVSRPIDDFVSRSTPLPHLRNLTVSSSLPISDLNKVLSIFNVPNLTSICITCTSGSFGTVLLSSKLDVTLQRLQEFTFVHSFNIRNVTMFLRRMPSLRRLELGGSVSLDQDTANQISTGQLGPRIDTFSFTSRRSLRRVLNMIEKRQKNAKFDEGRNLAPFTHVRLGCPVDSVDKYKERVERLERQHNVWIQMSPFTPLYYDGDSEEED